MSRTEYYVDPSAGNDTTGTGAIGTPWKTVQKALDTITRNGTDGDRVNVKDTADDVLSSALDFTTYGAPAAGGPFAIQGYTSAAGDGGVGGISGGGLVSIVDSATLETVSFVDMHLHNCGAARIAGLDKYCQFHRCEIDNTTGNGVEITGASTSTIVNSCHIHNIGGVGVKNAFFVAFNYFANGANDFTAAIESATVLSNIISIDGSSIGVRMVASGSRAINNTILSAGGTGKGIHFTGANQLGWVVFNNYVEGFSGAGGSGITLDNNNVFRSILGNNAFFNNTTNTASYSATQGAGFVLDLTGNDLALGATGLAKSGADTFANRATYFAPATTIDNEGYPTVGGS